MAIPTTTSNIYRYQIMLENAIKNVNPDKERTLEAWQRRTIITRNAVLKIKEENEAVLKELADTYSAKVFSEKRKAADADYNLVLKLAKDKAIGDLENILAGKRAQFSRSMDAPTDEQLRLLQVLGMRDSLSIGEVAAASAKFGNNLQALRLLRDIAKRHDIAMPDVGDPEEFEDMMKRAEQFSVDMLESIDKDPADLGYLEKLFWENPGVGEASYFYGTLDNQGFTAEQITRSTLDNGRSTPAETDKGNQGEAGSAPEMWAEVKLTGNEDLSIIANQFHVTVKQIRDANPGRDFENRFYAGDKILVPSTRFSYQPDPSGSHVQPNQVKAVQKPDYSAPKAPTGEEVGEDVSIV